MQTDNTKASSIEQTFIQPMNLPHVEIRTTLDSSCPYALHFHHTFSIGIILQGSTRFTCHDVHYSAQKGDIIFIEPEVAHQCNPLGKTTRSYHMLHVDSDWLFEQSGHPLLKTYALPADRRLVSDKNVAYKLIQAIDALHDNGTTAAKNFHRILGEIFQTYCLPFFITQNNASPTPKIAASVTHLQDTYEQTAPLVAVAQNAGLCRESFIRTFHKQTGLPPGAYKQCLRIEKARKLLRSGLSIADVAVATGYNDQSHFHRTFVKYCSATPGQYIRGTSHLCKK